MVEWKEGCGPALRGRRRYRRLLLHHNGATIDCCNRGEIANYSIEERVLRGDGVVFGTTGHFLRAYLIELYETPEHVPLCCRFHLAALSSIAHHVDMGLTAGENQGENQYDCRQLRSYLHSIPPTGI